MDIAIHTNPQMPHQIRYARHLHKGFARHGLSAHVISSKHQDADIHVIIGPHYARYPWVNHPRVLWVDRCYYRGDPDHVSIGWQNIHGGRDFRIGEGRKRPDIKENHGQGTIFLADYQGVIEPADTVRRHPAQETSREPLKAALDRHDTAIGYSTSALVEAALRGLKVICKDPNNIVYRDDWHDVLPYADWSWQEIENGEAWQHLEQ